MVLVTQGNKQPAFPAKEPSIIQSDGGFFFLFHDEQLGYK